MKTQLILAGFVLALSSNGQVILPDPIPVNNVCERYCVKSEINISTGINHAGNIEYSPGTRDEWWSVTSNIDESNIMCKDAYVIPPAPAWPADYSPNMNLPAQYISVHNSNQFSAANADYYCAPIDVPIVFERNFHVCGGSGMFYLEFDYVADGYLEKVYVDNQLIKSFNCPVGPNYNEVAGTDYAAFQLGPGAHKLKFFVRNKAQGQYLGFYLSGRLSTESQIIAKPTCYGKGVCTEECCPNSGERKRQVVAEINEKTISLYPNPVHNQINLTGSAELVQVCDGMGRIVANLQNVNVIECGDWPKGLYFVLVSDKGAFKQYRVVVE